MTHHKAIRQKCAFFVKKALLFGIFVFLNLNAHGFAGEACENAFSEQRTEEFIFYLEAIFSEGKMPSENFQSWGHELVQGKLTNPLAVLTTDPIILLHAEGLEFLLQQKLDINRIKIWYLETSRGLDARSIAEDTVSKSIKVPAYEMKFNRVEPGTFRQISEYALYPGKFSMRQVTLTHPFELMDTLATQWQYFRVTGKNPSFNKANKHLKTDGVIKPDHPVEAVSWIDAAKFANALSVINHLRPVYIFDANRPDHFIGIDAPENDIYRAEGYRLPTNAEFDFVLTERGKFAASFIPTEDDFDLFTQAERAELSVPSLHVGQYLPSRVGSSIFYDLLSFPQMTSDIKNIIADDIVSLCSFAWFSLAPIKSRFRWQPNFTISGVTDPCCSVPSNPAVSSKRIVRSCVPPTRERLKKCLIFNGYRDECKPSPYLGFRLARTLFPGKDVEKKFHE